MINPRPRHQRKSSVVVALRRIMTIRANRATTAIAAANTAKSSLVAKLMILREAPAKTAPAKSGVTISPPALVVLLGT
ncbi:unannotated protein [freshwater metagenome]|uniref:Unannotated protein n=1 Tax=freshwater metagenome TaxID=449393 RepID=A0A6J7ANT9_9ZZZZ